MEVNIQSLIDSGEPLLIDFYSLGCPACKLTAPAFISLQKAHGDKVKFMALEARRVPALRRQLKIVHVPTFIAIKDGKEKARLVGNVRAEALEELVKTLNG